MHSETKFNVRTAPVVSVRPHVSCVTWASIERTEPIHLVLGLTEHRESLRITMTVDEALDLSTRLCNWADFLNSQSKSQVQAQEPTPTPTPTTTTSPTPTPARPLWDYSRQELTALTTSQLRTLIRASGHQPPYLRELTKTDLLHHALRILGF